MELNDLSQQLAQVGFQELVMDLRGPNGAMDVHVHPFEAKALIFLQLDTAQP